jgi:hypothetical protein
MSKKNKVETKSHPDHWTVTDEIKVNGRSVSKGTELSIKGHPGRFLFIKHVKTPTTEWIDVVGGTKGYKMLRSFAVDSVKTVHWKNKTRENLVGK